MIFKGYVKNNKIVFNDVEKFDEFVASLKEGIVVDIEVKKEVKKRTKQQNRALHLYFTQLSKALNDDGFDMRDVIADDIDIYWTDYNVKENLWKPVQKSLYGKKSTTELSSKDIDKIYEVVNKVIGERTGIYIPFPDIDELYFGNL